MDKKMITAEEAKALLSVHKMVEQRYFNYILDSIKNANFYGRRRYIVSCKHLTLVHEKKLQAAGYEVVRGHISTQISW